MQLLKFTPRGHEQGWLIPIEAHKDVPFAIERVYYIYGTQAGVRRGRHAHRNLRQMAVCLQGSCSILMDDGFLRQEFPLQNMNEGLLIEPMVWHEMYNFSADCLLLVLASGHYDERDYIRDYPQFLSVLASKRNPIIPN